MATVRENIVNGIRWFYERLTSRYLDPMITMLLTGKVNGWLLDEDGNVIMSHDEDGLELNWRLYNQRMIANDFDESLSYSVGDYCVKDDKLYKFVEDKEPGDWDDELVSTVNMTDELTNHANTIATASDHGHARTINNLTTSSYTAGDALSAYQGYVLNSNISTANSNLSTLNSEISNKISVSSYTKSVTVSAGSSSTAISVSSSVDKSGYSAYVLSVKVEDITWIIPTNWYISSGTVYVDCRNFSSASSHTGTIVVQILYVKSTTTISALGDPDDDDNDTKVSPGPEIIDPDDGDGSDTGGNTNPDDGDGGDTGGTVDPDPNTPLPEDPNDGDDGDDDDSNNPDGDDGNNDDSDGDTDDNAPNDDDGDNEDGDNIPMEPVD